MNDVDYELGIINTLIEMANSFPFSQIKSHSTSSAILSWKKHPTISTINIFALFVLSRNTIATFRNWWHALEWNVNYWTLFIELLQIAHKASGKQSFSKSIQSRQKETINKRCLNSVRKTVLDNKMKSVELAVLRRSGLQLSEVKASNSWEYESLRFEFF